jgi:hypothetical protein
MKSMLHAAVLEALSRRKAHAVDIRELALELGAKQRDVKAILDDWKRLALIKTVGAYPYYFDPVGKDKAAIAAFLKQWRDARERPAIMKRLLELEKG